MNIFIKENLIFKYYLLTGNNKTVVISCSAGFICRFLMKPRLRICNYNTGKLSL